jgi:flagellar motor component MotA
MIEGVFYLLNDSEGVMNLGAINGSIVVIGLILGCIMMGSPWVVFVDPVSVFVVGAGSTAVLLAAHGTEARRSGPQMNLLTQPVWPRREERPPC